MMKKENVLKPLKLAAMMAVVFGLVFASSCSDDEDCTELTFYQDNDGDGLGNPDVTQMSCDQPEGYVANSDDTDDSGATQTTAEIVTANAELSTLLGYVTADAELLGYVSGTEDYTVFAPNNAAFVKLQTTLGVESLDEIAAPIVASVLRYHFVKANLQIEELKQANLFTTLQGEENSVTAEGLANNAGTAGTAAILSSTPATNGAVHVVETILIPPTVLVSIGLNLGSLAQPILLAASFTDVNSIIQIADADVPTNETALASILADPTATLTAFVPTNDVLTAVAASLQIEKSALIASVTPNAATARAFILNHIYTGGKLTADDVTATINSETGVGATLEMASGKMLTVLQVPTSDQTPLGLVLAGDPQDASTYIPIFAVDAFKAKVEVNGEVVELPGASNGSLHVSSIIQ